jgi:hypothetical protein
MSTTQDTRFATRDQFYKVLLRWMPEWTSGMPEAKLIAGIFAQAWDDGIDWFFNTRNKALLFYCDKTGLNPQVIADTYRKHNRARAKRLGIA